MDIHWTDVLEAAIHDIVRRNLKERRRQNKKKGQMLLFDRRYLPEIFPARPDGLFAKKTFKKNYQNFG